MHRKSGIQLRKLRIYCIQRCKTARVQGVARYVLIALLLFANREGGLLAKVGVVF